MATTAAGLLTVALFAGAPETLPQLAKPVQSFVDHLAASPTQCPIGFVAPEIEDRVYCASVDLDFRQLQKSVRKFIRRAREIGATQLGPWSNLEGGLKATPLVLGLHLLRLVFDSETATLLLVPADSCLGMPGLEAPGLYDRSADGIVDPERVAGASMEYPVKARMDKIGGTVILQVVVRRDGSVGERCVLHEQPPGYGFVESVLRSLDQWTYEPATLHGEPVDRAVTISLIFDIP